MINNNTPLDIQQIAMMIHGNWSNINPGMLETIASKMVRTKMNCRQVAAAIEQVASTMPYTPCLKDFMPYIPRPRKKNINLTVFEITFPNPELLAEFELCYSRADWAGCANNLLKHDWSEQNKLVKRTIKKLVQAEKEKQTRKQKANNYLLKQQVSNQFANLLTDSEQ